MQGAALDRGWLCVPGLSAARASTTVGGRVELLLSSTDAAQVRALQREDLAMVLAGGDHHRSRRIDLRVSADATEIELGTIRLDPGVQVRGTVVDSSGRPVHGAFVTWAEAPSRQQHEYAIATGPRWLSATEGDDAPSVRTDIYGRFALDGVGLGNVRVWARRENGCWVISEPLAAERRVAEVVLTVPDASTSIVSGRVVCPEHGNVPFALVRWRGRERTGVALADSFGAFVFSAPGEREVELESEARSREWRAVPQTILVGATDVVIRFERPARLHLIVEDIYGRPVPSACVLWKSPEQLLAQRVGTFRPGDRIDLPALRTGERYRIRAPGFRDGLVESNAPFAEGGRGTIVLERVPSLVGRVTLATGAPAVGATIVLLHSGDGSAPRLQPTAWDGEGPSFITSARADDVQSVVTNSDGDYRLTPPGDGSWRVRADVSGHGGVTSDPISIQRLTTDLRHDIAVPAGGAVEGSLTIAGTEPRQGGAWSRVTTGDKSSNPAWTPAARSD